MENKQDKLTPSDSRAEHKAFGFKTLMELNERDGKRRQITQQSKEHRAHREHNCVDRGFRGFRNTSPSLLSFTSAVTQLTWYSPSKSDKGESVYTRRAKQKIKHFHEAVLQNYQSSNACKRILKPQRAEEQTWLHIKLSYTRQPPVVWSAYYQWVQLEASISRSSRWMFGIQTKKPTTNNKRSDPKNI